MQSKNEISLGQLAEAIGGTLEGDESVVINGVAPLADASETDVSFLANEKYRPQISMTSAGGVIVSRNYSGSGKNLIKCDDPYFAFREAMVLIYGFRTPSFTGVSSGANIDSSSEIGNGVNIAPGATVAAGVEIGDGTTIYPGVFIGQNSRIGSNCILHPNTVIYDESVLGDRVTIHSCSSIGTDGFGYATHAGKDGIVRHEKIPQAGRVILEDDVEIGACCAIERATIGTTVIGAGTKFADLIGIGHGTRLGKHCLLVSQAGIAGSTIVGDYCTFAGQCGITGHIVIGDRVRVGAKAGVTNNLDSDIEVLGAPAIPRTEAKKVMISTMRLPEMIKTMKQLSEEISHLRSRIEELENGGQ